MTNQTNSAPKRKSAKGSASNFPSRDDVIAALDGIGRETVYWEHLGLRRWAVAYQTWERRQNAGIEREAERS